MRYLSYALLLFILAGAGALNAQTPDRKPVPSPQVFSWSFDGDGGYLGIQTEDVNRENLSKYGLREVRGAGVAKVMEDSPALAAGLQTGDVILRLNGEEITSSRKLVRLIAEIAPDHTAKLTVLRGGNEREVSVTLGKRPAPNFGAAGFPETFERFNMPDMKVFEKLDMPDMKALEKLQRDLPAAPGTPGVFSFRTRRQIGIGLTPLSKQLSDHFGVTNGALVHTVREGSPAEKAGIKAGDIIVELDGSAVKGEVDVMRGIAAKKEGEVTLTVVRDGNRQTFRVTPEEGKGEQFFEFREFTPDTPGGVQQPGVFKMRLPKTPEPMQLNEFFVPGRIV